MKIDKTSFYVWIMVLLFVLGVTSVSYPFESVDDLAIPLVISFFLSALPVLFSQSNIRWKNRFGYGIPFLLLLLLLYSVWDYYTCTGKFCQFGSIILGFASGFSAIVFAFFYTIGIRKFRTGIYLFLTCIELILLIAANLYFR